MMAISGTSPIARPARAAPNAGTSNENRCTIKPICANSPSAMPVAIVTNLRSVQSDKPGNGFAADDVTEAGCAPRSSPSGINPICCGVRENAQVGKNPHGDRHDEADRRGSCGKSNRGNRGGP